MDNIQQFFDPIRKMSPERKELSDLPYEDIYPLIEMCDLLSKANNISTYIIDYAKENFCMVRRIRSSFPATRQKSCIQC